PSAREARVSEQSSVAASNLQKGDLSPSSVAASKKYRPSQGPGEASAVLAAEAPQQSKDRARAAPRLPQGPGRSEPHGVCHPRPDVPSATRRGRTETFRRSRSAEVPDQRTRRLPAAPQPPSAVFTLRSVSR